MNYGHMLYFRRIQNRKSDSIQCLQTILSQACIAMSYSAEDWMENIVNH
jgi:hypothetical protein